MNRRAFMGGFIGATIAPAIPEAKAFFDAEYIAMIYGLQIELICGCRRSVFSATELYGEAAVHSLIARFSSTDAHRPASLVPTL